MLNEREIIANELNKQNDWVSLSCRKLDIKDMQKWINYLNWYNVIKYNFVPEDILEQIHDKLDNLTWRKLCRNQNLSEEFILKHKNNLFIDEILRKKYLSIKFITSNLIDKPKIGAGVTIYIRSDSNPFTIIDVNKTNTKIKIQADEYIPDADYDYYSNQTYSYKPNTNGVIYDVSLRKDGIWKILGSNTRVYIGFRRRYQDPSF